LIYLDSSALVKLVLAEPESPTLVRWLAEQADLPLVSSVLHRTEVPRAVWRASPSALPRSYRQMRGVQMVALSTSVLDTAATLPPPGLPSVDAIHLASALALRGDLTAFVAYDSRLLAAAEDLGLPTASPGSTAGKNTAAGQDTAAGKNTAADQNAGASE
jgi:predicted nucleic acid-binding protein